MNHVSSLYLNTYYTCFMRGFTDNKNKKIKR